MENTLAQIDMLNYTFSIAKILMMDLLDLAQIENNTFKINKANFPLRDVIKDAFKVVQHIADVSNVQLVEPAFKEGEEIFFKAIFGDRNRYQQVLVNFLSNALKFSDSGSCINVNLQLVEKQFQVNDRLS